MSTSKRGTYHHGDLREKLVELALEAIERDGPEMLAIRGLAEQAGVSGMAPYRHFADKAALLDAVARRGFSALLEQLRAVDDEADPRRAIVAFGVEYVRFACAHPGLFRVMYGGAPPTPDASLTTDPQTVYGLFTTRMAQLVPNEHRRLALLACWSMMHGFANLLVNGRIRQPILAPDELAEQLGDLLMTGVLARC